MIQNAEDNPGAFIIDGHGRADLGVVRALGEVGIPIYLATDDRTSPVNYSRYIKQTFDFPAPGASDAEKIDALIDLGRQFLNPPVFFSTGDTSLLLFARNKKVLEDHFLHHVGDADLMEALNDKRKFAHLSARLKLPCPYSLVPESLDELKKDMGNLNFPVMVKPAEKRYWDRHPEIYPIVDGNLKGMKVQTSAQLVRLYEALSPYDSRMVIQDYIEGRDEAIFSLHIHIDKQGMVKGWFTGQKIRTWPIHRGIGCFQLSVINREVWQMGIATLQRLGYTGHAIVQVKQIPGTDTFQIFEINCRFSTWNYLHTRAGVHLPLLAYLDSMGVETETAPEQIEGARWIDAANDIKAFAAYHRIGEWSFPDWARTYFGRNCYAMFAWNDPAPWALPQILRVLNWPMRKIRVLFGDPV